MSRSVAVVLAQFRKRETVHAYLLTGARGLGKRTFAMVLASALFCVSKDRPCGTCDACKRVLSGNEPDVITVFSDDGKSIGVDQIRVLLLQVGQHAHGDKQRVVLIEPMEALTAQAQNALLKSLEEPSADVVFLLMSHEMSATLGTIASRCARVKLMPWPDAMLLKTLASYGYDQTESQSILGQVSGNIGMAMDLLGSSKSKEEMDLFVRNVMEMTTDAQAVTLSTSIKDKREEAQSYLTALEQALYQLLLVRTGRLTQEAIQTFSTRWVQASQNAPIDSINKLLYAVFQAKRYRAGQVNWQSTIDQLLITILEEQAKWQLS